MSAGDGEISLQDKLQEQVSSSVREALDKSTAILSNLHRLSSYLDVMNTMLSQPDRLKTALDQIQNIRSDCATLLQTIYLGEIGLQSLQDVGKATSMAGIMPLFSDTLASTHTVTTPTIPAEVLFDDVTRHTENLNEEPSTKKSTVAVFTCHSCQRMFGTNADPGQTPSHCRKCQPNASTASPTVTTPSPLLNSTSLLTEARRQLKQRVSKRSKLNPMVCRLCGISFFYRRCMLRHLRENHGPVIDTNCLDDYLEVVTNTQEDTNSSQSSALDVTIGSELEGQTDFSLNVSTANATSVTVLNSGSHDNIPQSLDTVVTSTPTNFIEATAQSLQAVEHVLLSSQDSVQSHEEGSGLGDSSTLLSHITSTESPEMEMGGVMESVKTSADSAGSSFREYKCTICNKAFDRPYRLTRHLEIHDPNRPRIPCNYCTKSFTRKDSLESHIKTVHTSVHPYTCTHETCNRTFSTRSMYLNHQKVHGETKPYHCQECEESFTLLAELKEHLKKMHSENEESRCSECFKVCLSLEDLEQHKMYDHRFECEVCGKIFARLAYLQVHVKVHNGESKFNCRFCSDGFNSIYAYRQHMKTHPEYRRVINAFPCHACSKVFNDPNDLVAHYQTEEHKEKAATIGTPVGTSTALSMMEGDLSVMNELVTQVVMNDSEDMIHSIVDSQGTTYSVTTQPTIH